MPQVALKPLTQPRPEQQKAPAIVRDRVMSELVIIERCGQYRPRRGLAFEVRCVRRNAGLKPYGWEIVDYITGDPLRQSAELFRWPQEAWNAGMIAMAEISLEKGKAGRR